MKKTKITLTIKDARERVTEYVKNKSQSNIADYLLESEIENILKVLFGFDSGGLR